MFMEFIAILKNGKQCSKSWDVGEAHFQINPCAIYMAEYLNSLLAHLQPSAPQSRKPEECGTLFIHQLSPIAKVYYIYYIVYTYYYIGYWEMDGNETLQDKNHQQHCKRNLLHSLAAVFCDRPRYRMCFLQIAKAKSLVLPRPNKVDLKKKRRRSFQQRNHFCVPPFFGRIVGLKLTQVQWGIWMLEIEVLVQLRQVPLPEFHPWGPLGTGKSLWLNWVTHQELENDKWLPCVLGVLIQLLRQVEPKPLHLKFISFFCSLNPPLIVG